MFIVVIVGSVKLAVKNVYILAVGKGNVIFAVNNMEKQFQIKKANKYQLEGFQNLD